MAWKCSMKRVGEIQLEVAATLSEPEAEYYWWCLTAMGDRWLSRDDPDETTVRKYYEGWAEAAREEIKNPTM